MQLWEAMREVLNPGKDRVFEASKVTLVCMSFGHDFPQSLFCCVIIQKAWICKDTHSKSLSTSYFYPLVFNCKKIGLGLIET